MPFGYFFLSSVEMAKISGPPLEAVNALASASAFTLAAASAFALASASAEGNLQKMLILPDLKHLFVQEPLKQPSMVSVNSVLFKLRQK
jgi:hypothetical protein